MCTPLLRDHGQVRYLADSASADEIRRDKYGQYTKPTASRRRHCGRHFRDGQPHFAEYQDQFGQFRSLFVPGERRDGLRYVIGADIDVAYLQNRSHEALLTSLLIGGAIFCHFAGLVVVGGAGADQPVRALLSVTEAAGRWRLQRARIRMGRTKSPELAGRAERHGPGNCPREEAMLQLIYRDELTGLGNRLALDEALTAALSQHQMGVLMLVHLDRFRAINDLLGFAAGDLVLQVATTRLSELWPDDSRVHRLGGNVFALLVTGLPAHDSDSLHRQVFRALEGEAVHPGRPADRPHRHPGHCARFRSTAIRQAGLLLRNAEVALYAASRRTNRGANTTPNKWAAAASNCRCWASCAARSNNTKCMCFISRRSASTKASWCRPRRWCAGVTRSAAGCRRRRLSRLPSKPAASAR